MGGYKWSIVATAHKTLRIIFAMLRDGTSCTDAGIDSEAIVIDLEAVR